MVVVLSVQSQIDLEKQKSPERIPTLYCVSFLLSRQCIYVPTPVKVAPGYENERNANLRRTGETTEGWAACAVFPELLVTVLREKRSINFLPK